MVERGEGRRFYSGWGPASRPGPTHASRPEGTRFGPPASGRVSIESWLSTLETLSMLALTSVTEAKAVGMVEHVLACDGFRPLTWSFVSIAFGRDKTDGGVISSARPAPVSHAASVR